MLTPGERKTIMWSVIAFLVAVVITSCVRKPQAIWLVKKATFKLRD